MGGDLLFNFAPKLRSELPPMILSSKKRELRYEYEINVKSEL